MSYYFSHFSQYCHSIAKHGLVQASSGNFSVIDMERKTYAITPTGAWLEEVQDPVICDAKTGLAERGKPSSENNLHRAIYDIRPDVRAILHCQPLYTTLLCVTEICRCNELDIIPEFAAYCGDVFHVPYAHPGSQELVDAVTNIMKNTEIVIVLAENHGVFAVASSPEVLIQRCIFLEFASQLIYLAHGVQDGSEINSISPDQVARLKSEFFKV
jgi:L-fuculose-phosphate aldolase